MLSMWACFASYLDVNTMVQGLISYIHSYFFGGRSGAIDALATSSRWCRRLHVYNGCSLSIYIHIYIYLYLSSGISDLTMMYPPNRHGFTLCFCHQPWSHGFMDLVSNPQVVIPWKAMSHGFWWIVSSSVFSSSTRRAGCGCGWRQWMVIQSSLNSLSFFWSFLTHFQSYVAHDDPWSMCQKNMGHFGPMTNGDQWLYLIWYDWYPQFGDSGDLPSRSPARHPSRWCWWRWPRASSPGPGTVVPCSGWDPEGSCGDGLCWEDMGGP